MAAYETGCPFWLYAPDGRNYVSFNDPNEPNFSGYLTDVTGLDDTEVRESAEDTPAGHGGRSFKFYRGRRPWTMAGIIQPTTPAAARATASENIQGIMDLCLNAEGQIQWKPSDGIVRFASFRKQQSSRFTKGDGQVDKRFTLGGVIDDWRIKSTPTHDLTVFHGATLSTPNGGTADAAVHFQIGGPVNNPGIFNLTSPSSHFLIVADVPAGYVMDIDMTSKYPLITMNGDVLNGSVWLNSSNWEIAVRPDRYTGGDVFQLQDDGTGSITDQTYLRMIYNDSWI